jgi:hypothetical protein
MKWLCAVLAVGMLAGCADRIQTEKVSPGSPLVPSSHPSESPGANPTIIAATNAPAKTDRLEPVRKGLAAAREFISGQIAPVSGDGATPSGNTSTGNGVR